MSMSNYSCSSQCDVSVRWKEALQLSQEMKCKIKSKPCMLKTTECLRKYFTYSASNPRFSEILAWELFYYQTGNSTDSHCSYLAKAEKCFHANSFPECSSEVQTLGNLLEQYKSYNQPLCNNTDICDVREESDAASPSDGRVARTTGDAGAVSSHCDSCESKLKTVLTEGLSFELHTDLLSNSSAYGAEVCSNISKALSCYNSSCVSQGLSSAESNTTSLKRVRMQAMLLCDSSCRFADVWPCERIASSQSWCKEDLYNEWLTCVEAAQQPYDCSGPCSPATRRVNSYKFSRQFQCLTSKLDNQTCYRAAIKCIVGRYTALDLNFSQYLSLNTSQSAHDTCMFLGEASKCLTGNTYDFGQNKNQSLYDMCSAEHEKKILSSLNTHWLQLYSSEMCNSVTKLSTLSFRELCAGYGNSTPTATISSLPISTTPSTKTTSMATPQVVAIPQNTSNFTSESNSNLQIRTLKECPSSLYSPNSPCTNYSSPTECASTYDQWNSCLEQHELAQVCSGFCTVNSRRVFAERIAYKIHCKVVEDNRLCKTAVTTSCVRGILSGESHGDDFSNLVVHALTSSVGGMCRVMESFVQCLQNSVRGNLTFAGMALDRPCRNQSQILDQLIGEVNRTLRQGLCTQSNRTFAEACIDNSKTTASNNTIIENRSNMTNNNSSRAKDFSEAKISTNISISHGSERSNGSVTKPQGNEAAGTKTSVHNNTIKKDESEQGVIDIDAIEYDDNVTNSVKMNDSAPTNPSPKSTTGLVSDTSPTNYSDGSNSSLPTRVSVKMKVSANYDKVVGNNSQLAILDLRHYLSELLGLPVSSIKNLKVLPGSILIEFDIEGSRGLSISNLTAILAETKTVYMLNRTLDVDKLSLSASSGASSQNASAETGSVNNCTSCSVLLETLLNHTFYNSSFSAAEYQALICRKFDEVQGCYFSCNSQELGDQLSSVKTLRSYWCDADCPVARLGSCFATHQNSDKCGDFHQLALEQCIDSQTLPVCTGFCQPQLRLVRMLVLQRQIDCFSSKSPSGSCVEDVKNCFESLTGDNTVLKYEPILSGSNVGQENSMSDVCSFFDAPYRCLVELDFQSKCLQDESKVRDLAQSWRKEYIPKFCHDYDRNLMFGEKCHGENISATTEPKGLSEEPVPVSSLSPNPETFTTANPVTVVFSTPNTTDNAVNIKKVSVKSVRGVSAQTNSSLVFIFTFAVLVLLRDKM